jgi:hypothetical protein
MHSALLKIITRLYEFYLIYLLGVCQQHYFSLVLMEIAP